MKPKQVSAQNQWYRSEAHSETFRGPGKATGESTISNVRETWSWMADDSAPVVDEADDDEYDDQEDLRTKLKSKNERW